MTCTEKLFLNDVKDHQMEVIRDDGINRHIRFSKPGTGCYRFDLITWPGVLCYTGDMGTYVFSRIADMFEFFRMDKSDWNYNPKGLSINPGYWSEKLLASDCNGRHANGVEEFDKDKFIREINSIRIKWLRDAKREETLNKDQRRDLWEAVDNYILYDVGDYSESEACRRVYDFYFQPTGTRERYSIDDFSEVRCGKFSFHYIWCCHALAWGIS